MEISRIESALISSNIDPACEAQYNLRARHPERTEIYREFAHRSAQTRRRSGANLDLRYGAKDASVLDLFVPENGSRPPLLIFIHGGYWRALDKHDFSFIADAYLSQGVAVAMPNYDLAPQATVSDIVAQVCDSVSWLAEHGESLGYDDNRIVISGHSAGGHMAARAICREHIPLLAGKLLGYVGLSALFDLEPLLSTSINNDLNMSAQEAQKWSLYGNQGLFDIPMLLAVGELETQGFQKQSLDFSRFCEKNGHQVENMVVPQRNHFDLLMDFASGSNTTSPLFDKTMGMFRKPGNRP
ncbi:alpha/beta hydrolase [Paralcaligenes ginsengisoli]